MTGSACYQAALALLGETTDSALYYEQFAVPSLNQLLANCLREINAKRDVDGLPAFAAPPRIATLNEELPADDALAAECFPYGLAALLTCDDDKDKFNWAGSEFATRLLSHCPAMETAVQEMV